MSEFHFLRPFWFLALIPALWLLMALWRKQSAGTAWSSVFDSQLLARLWLESPGKSARLPLVILAIGWLLAVIILAGPVWERQPEQVWRSHMARVVILDLSPSMNANDVSPSRLERARFKLMDILARSTEGRTGLVVFAGEAHVVTPLTEDNETIKNLITALSTGIMPVKGDAATPALQMAGDLLNLTGIRQGELLLISDGIADPATALAQARKLREQGYRLSILGIGTEQGGTVRHDGIAEFVRFNPEPLQELARAGGGTFSLMTTDDRDLNRLLPTISPTRSFDQVASSGVERWVEHGVWLLPLLLLLASMAFRRGWLMGFAILMILPPPAHAFGWQDLWLRSDQQAQHSLNQGDPQTAAQQFRNPHWRGMALYETGDYEGAAQAFAESNDIEAEYNQGNALARTGDLHQAIAAYRKVLQQNPAHEDAKANLELLEKLQRQQSQQEGKDEGDFDPSPEETSDEHNGHSDDSARQQADDAQPGEQNTDQDQSEQPAEAHAEQQQADEQQSRDAPQDAMATDKTDQDQTLPSEEAIALEQWLRQIPEDPSGLLRRKFMLEHLQRKQP
ncbi:MAG: VWA domain-containing protein [Nitrosomonas sp.]|nr:VWA domain-containing protein [Nitrosomonas sp.]MDP1950934.1 VWA domain-containing protein [Nitrosomonas sp.]